MAGVSADPRIEILGPEVPGYAEILTADALKFLSQLSREFGNRREQLLHRRHVRQQEIDSRQTAGFPGRNCEHPRRRMDRGARSRRICRTGASRSPARWTAR